MTRPWLSVIGLGPEGEAGLTAGALAALGEVAHVVARLRVDGGGDDGFLLSDEVVCEHP